MPDLLTRNMCFLTSYVLACYPWEVSGLWEPFWVSSFPWLIFIKKILAIWVQTPHANPWRLQEGFPQILDGVFAVSFLGDTQEREKLFIFQGKRVKRKKKCVLLLKPEDLFEDTHKEQACIVWHNNTSEQVSLKSIMRSTWHDTKVTTGTRSMTTFWEGCCKHCFQLKFLEQ